MQLKADRAAAGLTQDEASRRAGMSKNSVERLENGQRVADSEQLGRLCSVYGTDLGTFFARVDERLARLMADPLGAIADDSARIADDREIDAVRKSLNRRQAK